jgi:hypothetical protein
MCEFSEKHHFEITLEMLQPSQLYICQEKLQAVETRFLYNKSLLENPLPIIRIENKFVLTDGHTRAFCAFLKGYKKLNVCQEEDDIDLQAYKICLQWCLEENITNIGDLANRIINRETYEKLWIQRCSEMHRQISEQSITTD